jgi:uncharacterized protein with PIN domain
METLRCIIDQNAGKLVKWLRMLGYDAVFFTGDDDSGIVSTALSDGRVILTRDTGIMKRRLITSGQVKAVLLTSETPRLQMRQVIRFLGAGGCFSPFTRCMECNEILEERKKEEVKERVPPYVYQTQDKYMECPSCRRVYWRGTHWQAMLDKLNGLIQEEIDGSI